MYLSIMVSHSEKIMQIAFEKTVRSKMLFYFTLFINNFVRINPGMLNEKWQPFIIIIPWEGALRKYWRCSLVLGKKSNHTLEVTYHSSLWQTLNKPNYLMSSMVMPLKAVYRQTFYAICGEKIHGSLHPLSFSV